MSPVGDFWGGRGSIPVSASSPPRRRRRPEDRYQPVSNENRRMRRRIKMLRRAFPLIKDNPDMLLRAAELNYSDDELVERFGKLDMWDKHRQQARGMRNLPDDQQRALWGSYTKANKRVLQTLGYEGPPEEDPGLFGDWSPGDVLNLIPGVAGVKGAIEDFSEGDWLKGAANLTTLGAGKQLAQVSDLVGEGAEAIDMGLGAAEDLPVVGPAASIPRAALGGVGTAVSGVSDTFSDRVASPVLNTLETVGDLPTRAYRAGRLYNERYEREHGEPTAGGIVGFLQSPGDWIDAWNDVENPVEAILPDARRRVRELFEEDPEMLSTVEALAAGKSLEELAERKGDPGSVRYQDEYARLYQLQGRPKVQKALEIYQANVISPGADLVRGLGIDPTSDFGSTVATATDFTFQVIFDPWLIGGKALRGMRLRNSIPGSEWRSGVMDIQMDEYERLQRAFGDDVVDKARSGEVTSQQIAGLRGMTRHTAAAQRIAERARVGQWDELSRELPHLRPLVDDLQKWDQELRVRHADELGKSLDDADVRGIRDFHDVFEFYDRKGGTAIATAGRYARPTANGYELPSLTRVGVQRARAKLAWEQKISDWANPYVRESSEVFIRGGDGESAQLLNAPDPEPGMTRLYRIQVGSGVGATHGVPGYNPADIRSIGDADAMGHWWTSNLDRAGWESRNLMPTGRLHYVDVPDEVARTNSIGARGGPLARAAQAPDEEFILTGDEWASREVGAAHMIEDIGGGKLREAAMWGPSRFARIMQYATKQLPRESVLRTAGAEAPVEFGRLLDLGYSGGAKSELFNAFVNNPSPAFRRNLIRSVLDQTFYQAGVYQTADGAKWAEQFLSGWGARAYGSNMEDVMVQGPGMLRQPYLATADYADGVVIPSMREIQAHASRVNTLSALGIINRSEVDAFMGHYWKPAVLLRIGFIPRAAGEEALATILRYPDFLKQRSLVTMDKWLNKTDEPLFLLKPLIAVAEQAQMHLPEFMLRGEKPWTEKFANIIANNATGWVRGMAWRHVDPDMLDFARAVSAEPAVQRAWVQGFYGLPGGGSGVAGTPLTEGMIRRRGFDASAGGHRMMFGPEEVDEPTGVVRIQINQEGKEILAREMGSRFMVYGLDDAEFGGMFRYQVNHFMDDAIARPATLARAAHVHDDEARGFAESVETNATRVSRSGEQRAFEIVMNDAEGDAFAYVANMRRAVDDASPEARAALRDYLDNDGLDGVAFTTNDGAEITHQMIADRSLRFLQQASRRDAQLTVLSRILPDLDEPLRRTVTVSRRDVLGATLPPVEPGYVRLWRGMGGRAERSGEFPRRPSRDPRGRPGAWFSTERREAALYDQGRPIYREPDPDDLTGMSGEEIVDFSRGEMSYVDVPQEVADAARLTTGRRGGRVPRGEVNQRVLPDEWVQRAQVTTAAEATDQSRLWEQLWAAAEAGDAEAARTLARAIAKRELQNPANAKFVRDNVRFREATDGRVVAQPVPDGMQRVYYPEYRGAPPPGAAPFEATTDYDEAVDAIAGQNASLRFVDVPDEDLAEFHRLRPDLPQRRYLVTQGQMGRSQPLDPSGPLQRDGAAALPGITLDEALEDWAGVYVKGIDNLLTSRRNGRFLHEVGTRAAQEGRYRPDWYFHKGPSREDLPAHVHGPEQYFPVPKLHEEIIRFGFDRVIGPAVSRIAREPLFNYLAAKRFAAAKANVLPHLMDPDLVDDAVDAMRKLPTESLDEVRAMWRQLPTRLRRRPVFDGADDLANMNKVLAESGIENAKEWAEGLHNLGTHEVAALRKYIDNAEYAYGEAGKLAAEGAMRDMMPYIDDHAIRSQLADLMRNVVPFWFAEEQFLKRWARTLVHSPEALERARLIYLGAKHVGFIQQNQFGEDVFIYPGSAELHELIAKVGEQVFGMDASIAIAGTLTGAIQSAAPGFDKFGTPGLSPVVGVPLTLIGRRFPELSGEIDDVLGQTAGRSIVDQLVPTSVMRVYRAITADPESDAYFAGAMIRAMQYLEANGHTPPEDAPPEVWDQYHERVEDWARILLINQAVLGFIGPASPQQEYPGGELAEEFVQLMRAMPIEEAQDVFLKRHPDATAYTVFSTENVAGAPLVQTKKAGEFIDNNQTFIKRYKLGSAWLLPQPSSRDAVEDGVYDKQVQAGFRERRTPQEWQTEYFFKRAAGLYFDSKERYDIALDSARSSAERKKIEDSFRKWKDGYFAQHPTFASLVQSRNGETRRKQTIEELQLALNDPDLPDGVEHIDKLRTMVASWTRFDSAIKQLTGDRSDRATKERKKLRVSFHNWGTAYVEDNPSMASFWRVVLSGQVGLSTVDEYEIEGAA